ncbi:hypothetical protein FAES_2999 [Fibrella aestuarina BUZ 2]|uniref:Lipoprotein n=1 Tax=Fibrella aestuarina BUZ 2 TaxID=1166018 RepID=I0KA55_9BACT|nr:hypothetical protein [Fibrella aestuarina]CCH01008.1 hypothetical protein FAES_2999 [Fibrella aestuarina BUZ 2]
MNRFVNVAAASLFASATLFLACTHSSSTPSPANQIKLGQNQSGRLSSGVTVKVDSLSDSRCPINAICIWGGNVVLRAVLTKDTDTKSVRLTLGPDPANPTNKRPDSTGVVLGGTTYKVVLRDVTPFPGSGSTEPKQALVEVAAR